MCDFYISESQSISLRGKNMTTITNNLNEQLFTELTPEESAVIGGGGLIQTGAFNFDSLFYSRPFKNNKGTKIQVNTITRSAGKSSPSNTKWTLSIERLIRRGVYRFVDSEVLSFNGKQKTLFTGLATGGTYRLKFSDVPKNDGKTVLGSYEVYD